MGDCVTGRAALLSPCGWGEEAAGRIIIEAESDWKKKVRDPVAEFCMQNYGFFILS